MLDSDRPSHKELTGKIRQAKTSVNDQPHISIIDLAAFAKDALELGYSIKEELIEILNEIFETIDPTKYVGTRPPKKSYKVEIRGAELYAFKFHSERFECAVYLKFAFDKRGWLCLVSLHKDR